MKNQALARAIITKAALNVVVIANIATSLTMPITFMGIVETDVSKNNFSCSNAASSSIACHNQSQNYIGFDFEAKDTLQIFKDQAYWLHQKGLIEQYALQNLDYTPSSVKEYLNQQGWSAMGDYCLLITTNKTITDTIKPTIVASKDEVKIVAQLFYSGDNDLQLWSEDVAVASKNSSIQIQISNKKQAMPNKSVKALNSKTEITTQSFSEKLNIGKFNRIEPLYDGATENPRSITIVAS